MVVGTVVGTPTTANAACIKEVKVFDDYGGFKLKCVKWDDSDDTVDNPTVPTDGDEGDTGNNGGEPTCTYGGLTIPCETVAGTWNGRCYAALANPQPDSDDPVWQGNTDGVIITCTPYPCVDLGGNYADCEGRSIYWAATAPGADRPSERELADRAVARMQLQMGQIGTTPPSTAGDTDSKGLIGVPTWLWIDNPGPSTTGPLTESATGGTITVTATATLERTVWTYADATTGSVVHTVTCTGKDAPGTPWNTTVDGDGTLPSPTCGLTGPRNDTPGQFTLTGAAHWVVDWEGPGQTGTIALDPLTRSTPVTITELQTIIVE